jgi:UDP-N-acetylmuramyl pentapeptide phosphotransferase/UDP-N-acetylglucosamine-1-phosphate transferase
MLLPLASFLFAAAVSLSCTPPLVRALMRSRSLDVPNERSSHDEPVPVGGGLGILGVWLAGLVALGLAGSLPWTGFTAALALGAVVLGALGLIDDRRPLPPILRLVVQSLVAAGCLKLGGLAAVGLAWPGTDPVALGATGWIVSWLFVVGFTNMFNFMDGIDGLAGFQALLGSGALAVWSALAGDVPLAVAAALLAGATVGFQRANFQRARVFMGDVGSLPLGFLLAMGVLRVHVGPDFTGATPLWLPLLFVWPSLGDATYTLLNRAAHGRNPFRPHRSHVYQRLVVAGMSHARVSSLYAAAMAACIAAAFAGRARPMLGPILFWGIFASTLATIIAIVGRVRAAATRRGGDR